MTDLTEPRAEVYPRAPLAAVAIEIHYKPVLDAFERLGRFQRSHDGEYPRVMLPDDLDSPALRRRRVATLLRHDGTRAIALGRDLIAAVTYVYDEGHKGFLEWSMPLLREALGLVQPSRIERVRYVYENQIALERGPDEDEGRMEIESKLRIVLPRAPGALPGLRHLHLAWRQGWPHGAVDISVDCDHSSEDAPNLQLNIVGDCSGPFSPDELDHKLHETHRMARLAFESIITAEYRDQLQLKKGVSDA